MNTLTIVALACMAVAASAKPSGLGVVVSGPSGVVTGAGPIGPVGIGIGHGGGWDDGSWDDGSWGGHSNVVAGNGALLVGPSAGKAILAGPVGGLGLGLGGLGLGGIGIGHGLGLGVGVVGGLGHGVVVKGPPTVPATIVGPAGKVVADGLWGPTHIVGKGIW